MLKVIVLSEIAGAYLIKDLIKYVFQSWYLFYLFSIFGISLAYAFYYTVKCSYEEQNLQEWLSELVQN